MKQDALRRTLEEALRAERDGYHLYAMAFERSEDPAARAMFAKLAQDERSHHEQLQQQYRSVVEGAGWRNDVAIDLDSGSDTTSEMFDERFRHRISGSHLEMSALSLGIHLERRSAEFYADRAKAAKDPAIRRFFTELSEWEGRHYRILLALDDSLKEEYWSRNRFAPL